MLFGLTTSKLMCATVRFQPRMVVHSTSGLATSEYAVLCSVKILREQCGCHAYHRCIFGRWVTSTLPGRPRDHDLLYWAVLEVCLASPGPNTPAAWVVVVVAVQFDGTGKIQQLVWQDTVTISLPD
jgi:hypothetical protein